MFRIEIDRTLCSGFGSCLDAAPGLIELGGDGIAVARVESTDAPAAFEAATPPDGRDHDRRGAGELAA